MTSLGRLVGLAVGYFVGIIVHEWAHAVTAHRLGDRQVKFQRRLTLNPKAHADPVGTIVMPAIFTFLSVIGNPLRMHFGYARPIPWNPSSFKKKTRDTILIALAGPAVNLVAAFVFGIGAKHVTSEFVTTVLLYAMTANVFILVVNAIPIPGLDGGKILSLLLSPRAQFMMLEYQQYTLLVIVVLLLLLPGVPGAMANPVCRAILGIPIGACPT